MAWEQQRSVPSRRVGLAAACVLALFLILPVQLATIIAFDETGLDAAVPDLVFVAIVPALVVATVPAYVAYRLYSARAGRTTLAAVFLATALLATYLQGIYGLCGPGC